MTVKVTQQPVKKNDFDIEDEGDEIEKLGSAYM
jgi:hypothetical protein